MAIENVEPDTFPQLLLRHSKQRGDRPALREKKRGIWRTVTWRELADEAAALAAALIGARRATRRAYCFRRRQPAAPLYRDVRGALARRRRSAALSGRDRRRDRSLRFKTPRSPTSLPRTRSRSTSCWRSCRAARTFTASSTTRIGDAALRPARACQLRRSSAAGQGTCRRERRRLAGRARARQPARMRRFCSSPRARPGRPRAWFSPIDR